MTLLAAGPVPAAEAGVGQPHRGSREDDQPQRRDRDQRETQELRRGELEVPQARGRRLDVHQGVACDARLRTHGLCPCVRLK